MRNGFSFEAANRQNCGSHRHVLEAIDLPPTDGVGSAEAAAVGCRWIIFVLPGHTTCTRRLLTS
jgi:hypothetical protein